METGTSSVHQGLLLTCAGVISATLPGLLAMAELLASSQFLDATAASNEKRKSTYTKYQSSKPTDGEENENENNDSENDLGEDQDVLENGEGKNAPTKDGANEGRDVGNDNSDGGSENSGDGGDDEDNDDDENDENDEGNNEDEEDVDEEDAEEDNFEGEEDEDTLPPPKKRKK